MSLLSWKEYNSGKRTECTVIEKTPTSESRVSRTDIDPLTPSEDELPVVEEEFAKRMKIQYRKKLAAKQKIKNIEISSDLEKLNSMSDEQLREIKGIGPKVAKKIISNQPYETMESFEEVVSASLYSRVCKVLS